MNKTGTGRPPRWGVKIFRLLYRREDAEQKLGDLEEIFRWRDSDNERFTSRLWFYGQVLRLIWSDWVLSIYWSFSIKNSYSMYFSFFNVVMYLFACSMGYVVKESFQDIKNKSNKSNNENPE